MTENIIVPEYAEPVRIDRFLADELEGVTRTHIQKLIDEEKVLVFDKKVKSNYKVAPNDHITIDIPEPKSVDILPEDIELDILYEDDDVLVVNKPKGMVVHPAAGHESGTLVNAIMYHCKDSLSGINGDLRPGIVHRIDMDTTGSLIICKNDFTHVDIAKQISEHTVNRIYEGIVSGHLKEDESVVKSLIGRDLKNRKKMSANTKNGKEAITHFKVLDRLKNADYVRFKLETGRTHQIRVHMSMLGHPLLGDELYGSKKNPYHLTGQTLHAKTIGFIHPRTGEYMEFEAPLPMYFTDLLNRLRG